MKQINNWINDFLLVLFPADSKENEVEDETVAEKPMVNFVVLALLIFTVVMLVLSGS
ncbi:hypothetical protein [Aequorivita viscosa]|uniref:Uncharacterized protein n=1 Tax=Aequorivita viscosa TaxID=797419 RepID=A0A1M6MG30_9FLAO|nr:hypothetical protein [Aequorivita viscosa]SDX33390.1 hypothetical protein SAMN05216556_12515 [Aequorivita viscosa]SHJ82422.1 hypothetical protein SAMN04487908_12713 [Aequorivita viscosa]